MGVFFFSCNCGNIQEFCSASNWTELVLNADPITLVCDVVSSIQVENPVEKHDIFSQELKGGSVVHFRLFVNSSCDGAAIIMRPHYGAPVIFIG